MKVVGVYSIKGGVGKTATAVNLAYLAARDYHRTLLWDLDPQGASTFYFRVRPRVKGGVSLLLSRRDKARRRVKATDYRCLDLLPADPSYRYVDLVLSELKKPRRGLRRVMKGLRDDYDWAFLDCPPSISLVSDNVFRAVDALLVPVIPTTLSLRTLEQLSKLRDEDPELRDLPILPFFSMVDRRKKLHRKVVQELPDRYPGVLQTRIPYSSAIEQMGVHRGPVFSYEPNGSPARAYETLWDEVRARLG